MQMQMLMWPSNYSQPIPMSFFVNGLEKLHGFDQCVEQGREALDTGNLIACLVLWLVIAAEYSWNYLLERTCSRTTYSTLTITQSQIKPRTIATAPGGRIAKPHSYWSSIFSPICGSGTSRTPSATTYVENFIGKFYVILSFVCAFGVSSEIYDRGGPNEFVRFTTFLALLFIHGCGRTLLEKAAKKKQQEQQQQQERRSDPFFEYRRNVGQGARIVNPFLASGNSPAALEMQAENMQG